MKTLPIERHYETFSYLPPLNDQQIARQIQYTLDQGYYPCIEFTEDPNPSPQEFYWTMWKLPLFSCRSPQEALGEVQQCKSEYPNAFIRIVAFDNVKQCQVMSFIVQKPGEKGGSGYRY
jgi:ribulose-bisphosphate carboxylase small chain